MARFQAGQSGNPSGKPKGANKTQQLRARLLKEVPAILDSLITQARNGDTTAARLVLERALPALRPEPRAPAAPVPTDPAGIVAAVADGRLTPDQGEQVMALLLVQAKVREVDEIVARLDKIEAMIQTMKR